MELVIKINPTEDTAHVTHATMSEQGLQIQAENPPTVRSASLDAGAYVDINREEPSPEGVMGTQPETQSIVYDKVLDAGSFSEVPSEEGLSAVIPTSTGEGTLTPAVSTPTPTITDDFRSIPDASRSEST